MSCLKDVGPEPEWGSRFESDHGTMSDEQIADRWAAKLDATTAGQDEPDLHEWAADELCGDVSDQQLEDLDEIIADHTGYIVTVLTHDDGEEVADCNTRAEAEAFANACTEDPETSRVYIATVIDRLDGTSTTINEETFYRWMSTEEATEIALERRADEEMNGD